MDPNAALDELRQLSTLELEGIENDDNENGRAYRMAELTAALDGWLMTGGALPTAWRLAKGGETEMSRLARAVVRSR